MNILREAGSPVSDDLFRARVEPSRAAAPTEAWPEEWDEGSDEVLDDLMASFDRHRVELDQRLKPAAAEDSAAAADAAESATEQPDADSATPPTAAVPEPPRAAATVGTATPAAPAKPAAPTALPSRRVVAPAPAPQRRSRKPWLIAGALLAVTAGVGGGVAALAGSPSGSSSGSGSASPSQPTPPADGPPSTASAIPGPDQGTATATAPGVAAQAADWIVANVGPAHVVACDVTVCALLSARGFPAASLITVQSQISQVEQADVVVVTDIIRHQLGASLTGVTADEPLAVLSIGSAAGSSAGSSTLEIRAVALNGPQAYADRLAADREARKAAGAALLRNPKIVLTGAARTALSDGLVDSRVCALLAVLGGTHTLTVASFTAAGPGAGADLPLPGLVISGVDGVSAAADSPQTAALKKIVEAQRPPYAPLSVSPVASGPDQGLAIRFAQPSPIGLLGATPS